MERDEAQGVVLSGTCGAWIGCLLGELVVRERWLGNVAWVEDEGGGRGIGGGGVDVHLGAEANGAVGANGVTEDDHGPVVGDGVSDNDAAGDAGF